MCLNSLRSKTDFRLKNLWPHSIEKSKHCHMKQSSDCWQCILLFHNSLYTMYINYGSSSTGFQKWGVNFFLQGTFGNVWRHFCWSQPEEGMLRYRHRMRGGQDDIKYAIHPMHGTSPTTKNDPAPNVNSAEAEKLYSMTITSNIQEIGAPSLLSPPRTLLQFLLLLLLS